MSIWKYIDEYDSLPASDSIHCDTRDFYILCIGSDKHFIKRILKRIDYLEDLTDYKFRRDEILGVLKVLENETGGKNNNRILTTKSYWIKYIRFIKTTETIELTGRSEPVYIAFSIINNKYEPLSRKFLSKIPIKEGITWKL